MERLYLDALTGDEDAQLDFIRFIVTETDIPLPDVAVGWLTALAEPVNPCGQLYAMLSSCCEPLGDAEAAMKYLKKLHKLAPDDAQCCLALARNYAMGCGSRLDFRKAANLGDSYGTFMVGLHYYEGLGTRRNFKRAVDYFKRAVEAGNPRGYFYLGKSNIEGNGVRMNPEKGAELLAKGAEAGDLQCFLSLATCYATGMGVEPDAERAAELLNQARELEPYASMPEIQEMISQVEYNLSMEV